MVINPEDRYLRHVKVFPRLVEANYIMVVLEYEKPVAMLCVDVEEDKRAVGWAFTEDEEIGEIVSNPAFGFTVEFYLRDCHKRGVHDFVNVNFEGHKFMVAMLGPLSDEPVIGVSYVKSLDSGDEFFVVKHVYSDSVFMVSGVPDDRLHAFIRDLVKIVPP